MDTDIPPEGGMKSGLTSRNLLYSGLIGVYHGPSERFRLITICIYLCHLRYLWKAYRAESPE